MRRLRRTVIALMAVAALGAFAALAVLGGSASDARADGTSVVAKLAGAADLVGKLTGTVGADGDYGKLVTNASQVPFLGANPTAGVDGLFSLEGLTGLTALTALSQDAPVSDVTAMVQKVGPTVTADIDCAGPCLPPNDKVKSITSVRVHLRLSGEKSGQKDFDSLGLESLKNFVPQDVGLKVDLSWQIDVDLVADVSGLRLVGTPNAHELALTANVSLGGDPFTVDLGALQVRATPLVTPSFTGEIDVDFDGNDVDNPQFSFGADSGFHASWALNTTSDSPLRDVSADLNIDWSLAGGTADPAGLKVELTDLTLDTGQLIGHDLSAATEAIQRITHPVRKATAPMLEPLPGLSDLSNALHQGDTSLLSLAEVAPKLFAPPAEGFSPDFRKALTTLARVDDGLQLLGGGRVDLGSLTLTGGDALNADGLPDADQMKQLLGNLTEQLATACPECAKQLADLQAGGAGSFGFDFPVLKNPASLAKLLLGRDVDLFTFDTGKIGDSQHVHVPLVDVFIFSVSIDGNVEGSIHVKGGFDTAGIRAALSATGKPQSLLQGLYLQRPENNDAVVRLFSNIGLTATAAEVAKIHGDPKVDVNLQVPPDDPGPKLRPFAPNVDIGCALVRPPDGRADFSFELEATLFEDVPLVKTIRRTIVNHTFLSAADLCQPHSDVPLARLNNGVLTIIPGSDRGLGAGEADEIKLSVRHDAAGHPTKYVVQGNGNAYQEIDAGPDAPQVREVDYTSPAGDARPVHLSAVAGDGQPFEVPVIVQPGDGPDDISLDLKPEIATTIHLGGGNDTYVGSAGPDTVYGGPGDDLINGGAGVDVLRGEDGDDTIAGDEGADRIEGGAGDDVLGDVSDDTNTLVGGSGKDALISGRGADRLFGDEEAMLGPDDAGDSDPRNYGDDAIVTGGGADTVIAGNGNDFVMPTGAKDRPSVTGDTAGVLVRGNGGNDDIVTGAGDDTVNGGPGDDTIDVRGGTNTVTGGDGVDHITAGDGNDLLSGDIGVDTCDPRQPEAGQPPETATVGAGDTIFAGGGNDRVAGEVGDDTLSAGAGDDRVCGHAGIDHLDGGGGDDLMWGGSGDDVEHGGDGVDRMFGDLGGDTMYGEDGPDYMLGDQGAVDLTGGTFPGGAAKADVKLLDPQTGGRDIMDGGPGDDSMFGGAQDDTMAGGYADDHMEGNGGRDAMYGASATADDGIVQATDVADALFDGQDDMIGGSSSVNPEASKLDDGETEMRGDAGQDVMTGDNAIITRLPAAGGTQWQVDNITGGVARDVQLLDTDKRGVDLAPVGGPDTMLGNDGNDRMYGESDTDTVKGNAGEDYLEGNQDRDWLEGNAAQDDLIGGSAVAGQPDDGDYLHGGAGADVIAGDNAVITRDQAKPGGPYNYVTDRLEIPTKRYVKLLDLTNPSFADAAGADQISGGSGSDVLFGQDEGDYESGGSEDDYMEGNGDSDHQWGDAPLAQVDGVPPVIAALASSASTEPELSGPQGPDGQDDQIGGSSIKGQRDAGDVQYGNGAADFQLGDNGELLRRLNPAGTGYLTYEDANPTTLQRQANRFDVAGAASAWGADTQYGDAGDDYQYGQDGNDTQYGGDGNDDMYGELGDDRMFGQAGEDAMIGDRGVITDDRIEAGDPDDPAQFTVTTTGPMFNSYTAFRPGTLHRFVDLKNDGDGDMDSDGNPVEKPGVTAGGNDYMRGGDGNDSIHGAFGDDVANGDSGGDIVYGDDGSDALWGGRGSPDPATPNDRGVNDSLVDYVFGGHGGAANQNQGVVTGGADILDYRPRPGTDPASWLQATDTADTDPANNQHNQGIDWIYGGWDRDVMQANVGDNGPDKGDRLMDWTGAYNLYTHCQARYGDDTDVRQISPGMIDFLQKLAFGTGAGTSLADVQNASSSAYREIAIVYQADINSNSGKAYPTTPGHFDQLSCAP